MDVALIGSFKQYYEDVRSVASVLRGAGHRIVSPALSEIAKHAEFVRFQTDDENFTDPEVQSRTLRNIFAAHCVYVVNPNGYVGRTTCYEIGRVLQRRQPLYFLAEPADLPLAVPDWAICGPEQFTRVLNNGDSIRWLFADDDARFATERGLP